MDLSAAGQLALAIARSEAMHLASPKLEPEHILLGLLKCADLSSEDLQRLPSALFATTLQGECSDLHARLARARVSPTRFRRTLRDHLAKQEPHSGAFSGRIGSRADDLLGRAAALAEERGRETATLPDLLIAALEASDGAAMDVLRSLGLKSEPVLAALRQAGATESRRQAGGEPPDAPTPKEKPDAESSWVDEVGRDVTHLARVGKLDPVIGRDEEIRAVIQSLLMRRKSNVLLLGDAGVGKTAIVDGLAQRVVAGKVPEKLRSARIVEISAAALTAGTKYRGDLEERLARLIETAREDADLIIFIDEMHALMSGGNSQSEIAETLKPALARGELRCIGATTTAEYRRWIERDPAFERRFHLVWVEEPSCSDAIAIVTAARKILESHYGLQISDEAVEASVTLSMRYVPERRLPDKALDLLEKACSARLMRTLSGAAASSADGDTLGVPEVAQSLSAMCRLPVERLLQTGADRLRDLEEVLGRKIKGQSVAVRRVSESVRAAFLGLRNPTRPAAVFVFAGPTGTGKTKLAQVLAEALYDDEQALIRIDMSEYGEHHEVAKMIGSPPGYVRSEEGGQLVTRIREKPFSVVLFDEMEKAHPTVLDILLQVLDDGRLTDAHGRKASFRDAVVVFTTNLGSAGAVGHKKMGFGASADGSATPGRDATALEAAMRKELASTLRPEFVNRLQNIIIFDALAMSAMDGILDTILERHVRSLGDRGLRLDLIDDARALLIARGYSPQFGARELERTVENMLLLPLASMLATTEGLPPAAVTVRANPGGDGLAFERAMKPV